MMDAVALPPFERFYERAPRRGLRLPDSASGPKRRRGRLSGDVPAGAPRLSGAPPRPAPAGVGLHDRNANRDRRAAADAATSRAPELEPRPATTPAAYAELAEPRRRAAAERACRRRASVRLRPVLRRHRRGTWIERGSGAPGRIVRRPAPAKKGDLMTVPAELDARFREAAASRGPPRRGLRRRRLADRPAACRRQRAWSLPDRVRARPRGGARAARGPRRAAGPPGRTAASSRLGASSTSTSRATGRRFELDYDLTGLPAFQQEVLHELVRVPYAADVHVRGTRGNGRPAAGRASRRRRAEPKPGADRASRAIASSARPASLVGYAGGLERKAALLEARGRASFLARAAQGAPSLLPASSLQIASSRCETRLPRSCRFR